MSNKDRLDAVRIFVMRLSRDIALSGEDVADVKVTKVKYPFALGSAGLEVSFKVSDQFLGKSTSAEDAKEELLRVLGEENEEMSDS